MTHEPDTFLLQLITMRERLACLKTAAMDHVACDALIATMSKLDVTMAELESLARQSNRQSNGDHRNGDVPHAFHRPPTPARGSDPLDRSG